MSAVSIRALERGARRAPRRETIALLSDALGVDEERREALEAAADRARARGRAAPVEGEKRAEHLPLPSTPFVGRGDDVQSAMARLGNSPIVTLVGSGGIGKTRLALEIAGRAPSTRWKEICFVDLTPLSDGALIAGHIAVTLQPPPSSRVQSLNDLAAALSDRSLLLVLDNCEHLIADAAAAAHAVATSCPQVNILATSRERLQVNGESLHRLKPLALPESAPATLDEAAGYSALDLFLQLGRHRDPSIGFSHDGVGLVYNICRRLEGIPLAIELAVARLPFLGLKVLDARLDEHFAPPGIPQRTPTRQQTIDATIAWSFDLLGEAERELLSRLAVFSGGFTLDGAQSVCASDGVERGAILRLLASLADKSLVNVVQTKDSVRYVLLDSIRAFALRRLDGSGLQAATARRHAEWVVQIAKRIPKNKHREVFTELTPDLQNARAALAWALDAPSENDRAFAARIVSAWSDVWRMNGFDGELRTASRAALARLDDQRDPEVAADLLQTYITSYYDKPDVLDAVRRAIPLIDRVGSAREIMRLHSTLTSIFSQLGRFADARRSAARVEALAAANRTQMSNDYAGFLYNRSMLHEAEGRIESARSDIAAAEAIAIALDNQAFITRWLKPRLIFVECLAGNTHRAIEIAHEIVASEDGALPEIACRAYQHLACLHLLVGETDAAAAAASAVLEGPQADETLVVQYVAAIAALRGYPHEAARLMGFVDHIVESDPGRRDALQRRAWDILCASLAEQLHPDVVALRRSEGAEFSLQAAKAAALTALALPNRRSSDEQASATA